MREPQQSDTGLLAAAAVASALFGIIVGYIMGTGGDLGPARGGVSAAPAPVAQSAPAPLVNDAELQAYRDILAPATSRMR